VLAALGGSSWHNAEITNEAAKNCVKADNGERIVVAVSIGLQAQPSAAAHTHDLCMVERRYIGYPLAILKTKSLLT
jgi:hypothetical protein